MYTTNYTLNGTEIDHTFHLKPLLTASVFHDTFARMSYDLGVSAIHLKDQGLSWVLSDMHLQYEASLPFWREPYSIGVWIRRNQKVRIFTDFTAVNARGEVFARGTGIWLVIDLATRQPVVADHVFDRFAVENRAAIDGFRFPAIPAGDDLVGSELYKIKVHDIDFNNHLNSVRFLGGGVDPLGSRFLLDNRLRSVTVRYLKELLCDETIQASVYRLHEGFVHRISDGSGEEACRFLTTWEPAKKP